jgi:hypothetical protein
VTSSAVNSTLVPAEKSKTTSSAPACSSMLTQAREQSLPQPLDAASEAAANTASGARAREA